MLLAGAVLLAGYGSANAQVVIEVQPADVGDVYVASPYSYRHEYYAYRPGPRVYRYDHDVDDDVVIVHRDYRGGCGPRHRWNGDRCVYIRY
jgi:hypothetical protein